MIGNFRIYYTELRIVTNLKIGRSFENETIIYSSKISENQRMNF